MLEEIPQQTPMQTTQATPDSAWLGWQRVSDLCDQLGISSRTGSRWASKTDDPALCRKRPRAAGGSPEWWASPAGAESLKASVATGDTPVAIASESELLSSAAGDTADDTPDDAVVAALRLAIDEARARAVSAEGERDRIRTELTDDRDRLRRELQVETERRTRAEQQAAEAERGRVAYAEALAEERAAWWQWVSYLKGLSLLRRLRRLPDPPEALTKASKRLAPPGEAQ
jgi:hypothetical protein